MYLLENKFPYSLFSEQFGCISLISMCYLLSNLSYLAICLTYLLYLILLPFLYDIYVNQNKYVKKRNYFVFIIHQVNKDGVSRRWFAETGVKFFKSDSLRTSANIAEKVYSFYGKRKKNSLHFVYRCCVDF